jgi:hypothetical protein
MQKEIADLIVDKDKRNQILSVVDKKIMLLEEKKNQYREIALMQQEDYDLVKAKLHDELHYSKTLEEKLLQFQQKLDKINLERTEDIENPEEKQYATDKNFFIIVREQFINKNIFTKKIESEFKGIDKEIITKNAEKLKDYLNKVDHIDEETSEVQQKNNEEKSAKAVKTERNLIDKQLARLQLFRPNFFTLVHHRYNHYKTEVRPNRDKRISTLFLATLRGILDSKNNEFVIYEDVKKYSKFVDFVFSWLGKYLICEKNRKVKQLETAMKNIEDIRLGFLDDLMNPKIEKLWECETFREFLMEKYTVEELYFYCRCRSYLFNGPQVNNSAYIGRKRKLNRIQINFFHFFLAAISFQFIF